MNAYADRLARQQLRSLEMIMADQGYKQTVQFPAWLAAAIPGLSIAAVKSSRFQYYFFQIEHVRFGTQLSPHSEDHQQRLDTKIYNNCHLV